MKILIIIPAFNEETTVESVIHRVRANIPEAGILVINDGSRDNTFSRALRAGAAVVDLPFNLGIGGAMQTGYIYAKRNDYDIAVQVDGDGQHDPSFIRALVEPVIKGDVDMVIGSRYVSKNNYKAALSRRTGMLFFSALVKFLTGQRIKDTTSGFRAVNRKIINYFADVYPSDYPEVDVIIKLYKKNFKIAEIPVEMLVRQGGRSSITPFRSAYYMIKVSLSLIIGVIRSE